MYDSLSQRSRKTCSLFKSLKMHVKCQWYIGFGHLLVTWKKWRHFFQMTVTSSDVTSLAICPSFQKWRHISKFLKFFFSWKRQKLPKMPKKNEKKFQKFLVTSLQVTSLPWPSASHFSSDRQLNAVTVTFFKWRADGQSQRV